MADDIKNPPALTDEQIQQIIKANREGRPLDITKTFSDEFGMGGGEKEVVEYMGSGVTERQLHELKAKFGTEGVELDPRGLPGHYRGLVGLSSTPGDKEAMYKHLFGKNNVKPIGGTGRYIIRVWRGGKPVDVLDDEPSFTMRDISDLSGLVPEVATSLALYMKKIPKASAAGLLAHVGAAAWGAIGGQAAGGLKDAALRYAIDEPIGWEEIGSRRVKHAALETALGGIIPYAGQKVVSALKPSTMFPAAQGFSKKIAAEGVESARWLEAKTRTPAGTGMKFPLTAGEATGVKGIQEYEQLSERISRLVDPTKKLRAAQASAITKGQYGVKETRGAIDLDLGMKVAQRLGELESGVARGAAHFARTGVKEAEKQAAAVTGNLGQSVLDTGAQLRQTLRSTVESKKAALKESYKKADEARMAITGAEERFIVPTETSQLGKEIAGGETLVKEIKQTSPLLGPRGGKLADVTTGTTTEPISWAVPAYKEAQSFARIGSDRQSLAAMIEARATFGEVIGRANATGKGELGGGFSVGQAKRFYKALSQDIDASLKKLSPDVAALYKSAQTDAKALFDNYTRNPVLNRIRRDATEGGIDEVGDIMAVFTAGRGKPSMLRDMEKLLPPAEYLSLKRGILAELGDKATVQIGKGEAVIDFGVFQRNLANLHPEFAQKLVGGKAQYVRLQQALNDFGTAAEAGGRKSILQQPVSVGQDSLDALRNSLDDPAMFSSVKENIEKAIKLKARQRKEFANELTKKIRAGEALPEINADKFIDDFVLEVGDYKLVRDALEKLPQDLREEVARQTVRRMFQKSNEMARQSFGELVLQEEASVITGSKLQKLMYGGDAQRKIIQEILPRETQDFMDNLLKYQLAIETSRRNAGSVGGMARDYVLGNLSASVGNMAMARLIFAGPMQSFLKQAASSPSALDRLAAAIGRGLEYKIPGQVGKVRIPAGLGGGKQLFPDKVGPYRVLIASKLDEEVLGLANLWGEATKDLDDIQREALEKTYISLTGDAPELSDDEIAALVTKKKVAPALRKTLKEQRLQLRMPRRNK
jgi:hypothetical protein